MKKRLWLMIISGALAVSMLAACGGDIEGDYPENDPMMEEEFDGDTN
ncbi:hypothetical protein [Anaerobacillus arseniciselenatis]|nr:hypothetical protein [Anaerobacillus arseniciselenatis]